MILFAFGLRFSGAGWQFRLDAGIILWESLLLSALAVAGPAGNA
jgi:hypothetical protein